MELKFHNILCVILLNFSSNRTFMELKFLNRKMMENKIEF